MSSAELARIALDFPAEERLDLARRLVESVVEPSGLDVALQKGIQRIEDIVTGKVKPLTEDEYRALVR